MEFLTDAGIRQQVTPSNPLPVVGGGGGGAASLPADVTASGTLGALNATVPITPGPRDTLVAAVSGTFVETISLQGSLDGVTWFTVNGPATWLNVATGASATAITGAGLWQATISALPYVRLAATSYTSGSAAVVLDATDGNAMIALDAPLPAGSNVIGLVRVQDGYGAGTSVVVKAANTAPVAGDTSQVVTQSPNYVASATGQHIAVATGTPAGVIKASGGSLFELDVSNNSGATVYVKLFNSASVPVPGTTPASQVIPVATGQAVVVEFGQYGKRFAAGIGYAVTGGMADTDTTAIAAGVKLGLTLI